MQSFIHTIYRYEPQRFIVYIEEIHTAVQPLFYLSQFQLYDGMIYLNIVASFITGL